MTRRRRTALVVALVVGLPALGITVFTMVRSRQDRREVADALAAVERIFDDYERCTLGDRVADEELGTHVLHAASAGALDEARARGCAAAAQKTLARFDQLAENHPAFASFADVFASYTDATADDDAFGVCSAVDSARRIAAGLRGARHRAIDCHAPLPALEPTVVASKDERHERWVEEGTLYLDVVTEDTPPKHALRRSRDGTTWEEIEAPAGIWPAAHWSSEGAWSYGFVPKDDTAHYHVREGTSWHVGARAVRGRELAWRRTADGWTLILETLDDGAEVVWLDGRMDRVLARRPVPTLRGRLGWDEPDPIAAIDAKGDAVLYSLVANDSGMRIEAHRVRNGGASVPVTTQPLETLLPAGGDEDQTRRRADVGPRLVGCRGGESTFLVVPGRAAHVSTDGGSTIKPIAEDAGALPAVHGIACTPGAVFFADSRRLARCGLDGCNVQELPIAPHATTYSGREASLDVALAGEAVRVLVAVGSRLYLVEGSASPGGKLALAGVWRWESSHLFDTPTVRLRNTWFLL